MKKTGKAIKVWTRITKHGSWKVIRDSKGKIKKWEKSTTLDQPKGEYRVLEYIINFGYQGTRPSNIHNFEVRVRVSEGEYDDEEISGLAEEIMYKEFPSNSELVESCTISKVGHDTIGYSKTNDVNYKIIDIANPQYHYPKKGMGKLDDSNDDS
jgi:hypothetical protein